MGQRRRAGQIVNGYKFNLGIAEGGAKNVAANSAEAVDANLNCHVYSPSLWVDLLKLLVDGVQRRYVAHQAIPPNSSG
jgi:hypothetical protein